MLKIAILYNRPADSGHPNAESSTDVIDQVETVESALSEMGAETARLEVRGDLRNEIRALSEMKPDIVFNLVESVNENPLLYPQMAGVLELLGIRFTGSSCAALMACTDKNLAKLVFRGAGLPTPDWQIYNGQPGFRQIEIPPPWLVKPNFEDASIGIEESSLYGDAERLMTELPALWRTFGERPLMIEKYVDGREFNLSLLENRSNLEVLPVAEIDFSAFPKDKPKIVGYRAKWDVDSFEYQNTPRRFVRDDEIVISLKTMAEKACAVLGVRGYARVDFRVAPDGRPWILEVNPNPCLARDGGFMPAAETAGLTPAQTIARVIAAAQRKG